MRFCSVLVTGVNTTYMREWWGKHLAENLRSSTLTWFARGRMKFMTQAWLRVPLAHKLASFLKALVLLWSWMCFTFSKKSASGSWWEREAMEKNLGWVGKALTSCERMPMYSCRAKSSFDRSPFLTAATIVVITSSWKPSSSMKKGGKSLVNFNSYFVGHFWKLWDRLRLF